MRPWSFLSISAAMLAAGILAVPAAAEEPAAPFAPPVDSNAAAPKQQTATPAGAPTAAQDPRDQQIEELRRALEALQRRVDELEKRPAPPPAPGTPAPAEGT